MRGNPSPKGWQNCAEHKERLKVIEELLGRLKPGDSIYYYHPPRLIRERAKAMGLKVRCRYCTKSSCFVSLKEEKRPRKKTNLRYGKTKTKKSYRVVLSLQYLR